jgi:pilus assembly protein Flp/PilA
MTNVRNFISGFMKDEGGASAAEYALILAIVTTGIAGATVVLGQNISEAVTEAANCIEQADSLTTTGC